MRRARAGLGRGAQFCQVPRKDALRQSLGEAVGSRCDLGERVGSCGGAGSVGRALLLLRAVLLPVSEEEEGEGFFVLDDVVLASDKFHAFRLSLSLLFQLPSFVSMKQKLLLEILSSLVLSVKKKKNEISPKSRVSLRR